MKFSPGDTLPNGAKLIDIRQLADCFVVLGNFRNEYVTWEMSSDGATYWGHYFGDDRHAAFKNFCERRRKAFEDFAVPPTYQS